MASQSRAGTKTDTPILRTLATIDVVPAQQMQDQAAQSVAQAMRYTPGVFTGYRGASNMSDEMYLRGFGHVPCYIDGLRFDLGAGVHSQINPWMLERVGDLLGHGVRFGAAGEVLAVGEGIETVLSPRRAMPHLRMLATLSAAHLAAVRFTLPLRRLYVLTDRDPPGDGARDSLLARAASVGIEAISLTPRESFADKDHKLGIPVISSMAAHEAPPPHASRNRSITKSARASIPVRGSSTIR